MPIFDGPNLIITLDSGVTSVDVENDLYSEWKEWMQLSDNAKYPPAFVPDGGNPLTPGIDQGAYFFLQNGNGWRIRPPEEDITIYVTGNLAPQDPSKPIGIPTVGNFSAFILGLQPITQSVEQILEFQQTTSYEGAVHIDTLDGTPGTAYPVGTKSTPVSNMADALVVAADLGTNTFEFRGTLSIDQDRTNWEFIGDGYPANLLLAGGDISGSKVDSVTLSGNAVGSTDIRCTNSIVSSVTNIQGSFNECLFDGTSSLVAKSPGGIETVLSNCSSYVPGLGYPTISLNNVDTMVQIREWVGSVELTDVDDGTVEVSVDFTSGRLILDSTITAGSFAVRGVGLLEDNSTGTTIVNPDGLVSPESVAGRTWDSSLSDHIIAGSTGEAQAVIPPTASAIADAVWDEPLADHVTVGTMGESQNSSSTIAADILDELLSGHFTPDSVGEALTLIRGLVQQNYMVDSTVFNGAGLMTSARFRLFDTGAQVDAATSEGSGEGEIASFTVTAVGETSDPAQLRFYKVARD